jgi:hypothetical protein
VQVYADVLLNCSMARLEREVVARNLPVTPAATMLTAQLATILRQTST